MTELENASEANGKGTSLKHFIYLDRERLKSYSSQLSDGIVQLRRLTENEGNRSLQSADEEYTEEVHDDGKEGEFSLGPKNYAGGMSGKTVSKLTKRKGFKKGANTETNEFSQSFAEDRVNHDNEYLLFEKELIEKNILKQIKNESELKEFSSLIKITGTSRFFDWDSIIETFSHKDIQSSFIEQSITHPRERKTKEKETNIGLKIIRAFSLGAITVHTKIGNSNVIGSINPTNLCMTRDQLRSAYIMPGDVEITVVGFVPKRKVEIQQTEFPGIAGTVNMVEMWKAFVGEVDITIDPIAIYTEINLI